MTASNPVVADPMQRHARRKLPRLPAAGWVLVGLALACFVGAPFASDPNQIDPSQALLRPGWEAWFGTDQLGRDLFSRMLHGGQRTMVIAFGATVIASVIGIVWGAIAATMGGALDRLLMRVVDGFMAIPLLLFALVFASALGASVLSLTIICGLVHAPPTARIARIAFQTELSADYVSAARAFGISWSSLASREILPNALPAIAVQATLVAANTILVEATLSFLGLGVQPPDSTWGSLLLEGYRRINTSYWYIVIPGACVFVAIWALNLLGDRLAGRRGGAR